MAIRAHTCACCSIGPMPASDTAADYPRVTGVARVPERAAPAPAAAPGAMTFDSAFPSISARLMQNKFDVGCGSDLFGDKNWLMGFGSNANGGKCPSFTFFAEGTVPFDDANEFWWCMEQGTVAQLGDENLSISKITFRRDDGSTHAVEKVDPDFSVILRAFPAACDPASFPTEYRDDLYVDVLDIVHSKSPHGKQVSHQERWAFNYQLPPDWQATQPTFSFADAFPKCALWLTHSTPGQRSHWFRIEHGVIAAFNTKNGNKKVLQPVCQTHSHDTMHAAWAEMEAVLALPRAWGK